MAAKRKHAASARQVVRQKSGVEIGAGRSVKLGIRQAKTEMLRQEIMHDLQADLGVVDSMHVRHVGLHPQIAEPPVLRDGGKRVVEVVPAGEILNDVLPKERTDIQDGRRAEQMNPPRRDVVGADLLPLILPDGGLIVGIGDLEPGTRREQIQVQGVLRSRLIVEPVENLLVVSAIVQHRELGRIQKPPGPRRVGHQKIADPGVARAEGEIFANAAERPIAGAETSERLQRSQSRFGHRGHHQAGLIAIFRRRRARNRLERLDGVQRQLVRRLLVLLIAHRLIVDGILRLRVIAQGMEKSVGILDHSRYGHGQDIRNALAQAGLREFREQAAIDIGMRHGGGLDQVRPLRVYLHRGLPFGDR